ncbi:MAG: aminopeptidase P family protein [bacterium]
MFDAKIYSERRQNLMRQIDSGILIFLGNQESPINYRDNAYPFRQDSSFLYYWGLDSPGLAAVMDVDENRQVLFGNDATVEEIVWTGPQPLLREESEKVGVAESAPFEQLEIELQKALKKGRKIHFLPLYRAENLILLSQISGMTPTQVDHSVSHELVEIVVDQRSVKSSEEITQIDAALDISYEMHTTAMRQTQPGMIEREIAGMMAGLAHARGGELAFPIIFSVHGETLHNHYHGNTMHAGDMVVNDCGAASAWHYASDITRTIPVSGQFTDLQKTMYQIVYNALQFAIDAVKPGAKFKDIHLLACEHLTQGLKDNQLMKGNVKEAVAAGAHALFFQCGLGHMMGLDVHDMEALGEDLVGYDEETQRSEQFGLRSLRLGKRLQPGYVITVEPGLYFIPQLMDRWRAEKKFTDFINYEEVEKYREFGGIRIEEDVLVTDTGCRILGKPIPKTVAEVEELASS